MSFAFAAVKDQADAIAKIASAFPCAQALLSNKRAVYCFASHGQAIKFTHRVKAACFHAWREKGLVTDRYYVQVDFNYPTGY